jgi:uncharacterized protein (TIGR02687 family)
MDLKSIQEKLNSEFKSAERKLVFWFDDNGEFESEIDNINLENAKIYRLEKDNFFYTKYFLEMEDVETNYLIYANFPKPEDRKNHLADIILYSKVFYADKISLVMLDLEIPDQYKETIKKYTKFFSYNKYIDPFSNLNIESYNDEAIEIGILSVLCGIKTPNLDEVLRELIISEDVIENKYISNFDRIGVLSRFWSLCEKYYGYNDENPTLEKLIVTLLVTYTEHNFKEVLPKSWSKFISSKKNDIAVFVSNFMNNTVYKDNYLALSESLGKKLKVKELMSKYEIESYIDCDTFPILDELIIQRVLEWIKSESVNQQGLVVKIEEVINSRLKSYFSSLYHNEYKCLEAAITLIDKLQLMKTSEEIIKQYTEKLFIIDTCYRKFYYYFNQIEENTAFLELRENIEKIYTNSYLLKLSVAWGEKLSEYEEISEISGSKQYDFYKSFVDTESQKECTVVIISDALRYECAVELSKILNDSVKYNSSITHMISCIPSYTRLGMAALLPHKEITYNESYDVLVDGMPCISTEQRQSILECYNKNAIACTYNEIINLSRDGIRKLLMGKELVYVYHNQIDARGDNTSTENEVFTACEETFNEIIKLARKLTVDKSITNYIITSDHGFIYKNDKIDESDKVTMPKIKDAMQNKRFIITKEDIAAEGTLKFSLDYLSKDNIDKFAIIPRGVDIFKIGGGGQNYVHGGASLQEIIIPVIKLKTSRSKKETDYVEIALVSLNRRITNLTTYLDFMQNENVSDSLLPVVARLYFINELGEKISNENIIYADVKNEIPEKRMFKEKFTFRNRKYSKSEKYYLLMIDDKTEVEIGRYEFTIDIAFADDFGFGV